MTASKPLQGVTVADLSSGIPGGYCTLLLAAAGASVLKFEPPSGDPLRSWSVTPGKPDPGEDGALFQFLAAGKQSVVVDPADQARVEWALEQIGKSDAVVWSPGTSLSAHPDLSVESLHDRFPQLDIVALTPFGLHSSWSDRAATEFTLQAWSGAIWHRGAPERPPLHTGGRLGDWVTGVFGAVGLLAARQRSMQLDVGQIIDVSELEAIQFTLTMMHPVTVASVNGGPMAQSRTTALPGIEKTADGWVGFMVVTGQQWLDFCDLIEQPDWGQKYSLRVNREAHRDEVRAAIQAWAKKLTTAEVCERASWYRVPAVEVGNGATIPQFDQFVDQQVYAPNDRGGFLQPCIPWVLDGIRAQRYGSPPKLGEHDRLFSDRAARTKAGVQSKSSAGDPSLWLSGLCVADFTQFWAGPVVGHVLSMLGADVVAVESIQRPNGTRNMYFDPNDKRWWEKAPLYNATSTNKRAITLNMNSSRGMELARKLVQASDVVIENYSPRVFENWGLDKLYKDKDDLIEVRMPAFGLEGPWRDRTGYAQTMEQASGMAWVTGYPDIEPTIPNGCCDPIAGLHALFALFLGLEHRRATGHGMLVETPMVIGALNMTSEQVIEYSAYGTLLNRRGNHGVKSAPQNLYRCADQDQSGVRDTWIALEVESDDQWRRLVEALDQPVWAANPSYSTLEGRRASEDAIDAELSAWCATRVSSEIINALWPAGVPVAIVKPTHDTADLPPFRERGYFEWLEHPLIGTHPYSTLPIKFSGGPSKLNRRHAPFLGEHNAEVLRELGLDDDQIAKLEREQVIGAEPATG